MHPWITASWIVTAGAAAGLAAAFGRIWFTAGKNREMESAEAGSGFSLTRYQVMERLLSSRDLDYLASQPGIAPGVARQWKRESVRIFRLYLHELTREFHALHARARRIVAESHTDSPELAATLVRQQTAFWRARIGLELRLTLFELGIGRVQVAPLLEMIEAMRLDLGRLVPEPSAAL